MSGEIGDRGLLVDGTLTFDGSAGRLSLHGEGDRIVLESTTLRSLREAARLWGRLRRVVAPDSSRKMWLRSGLAGEVRLRGRVVASVDSAKQTLTGRLFGVAGLRVHPVRLALSAAGRGR